MRSAHVLGVAVAAGAVFAATGLHLDATPVELVRVSVLGAALGALVCVDLAEHRIPNRIVVPAGLVCAALLLVDGLHMELLGGLAVVALILLLGLLWPASFGMGDVKLGLLVVVGLGGVAAEALVVGIVLAALFGALLILRDGRSAGGRALPLAPFVAVGAALAMLA
jgi:leader peptidase (prepilin peptidase)/N-methyltransferase